MVTHPRYTAISVLVLIFPCSGFLQPHRCSTPICTEPCKFSKPSRTSRSTVAIAASTPLSVGALGPIVAKAFGSSGVQKVLELGVIASIGASLRSKLDAKAVTALLLNALVPAIIVSSLSTLSVSAEMVYVIMAGVILALVQLVAGELASRSIIKNYEESSETRTLQRTAAVQLGTMAPALSVFSFTREFVGYEYSGLAALADVPNKIYTLLLIPYYLHFRGVRKEREVAIKKTEKPPVLERITGSLQDPFNLAIVTGLGLAVAKRPISTLGFWGKAVESLAQAQTAILFLLIGLKLKWGGERPKLCLRLLLARHGFVSIATSAFLAAFLPNGDSTRLAAVLSSQAACSIVAFGQISKVAGKVDGYDTDLAFDLVALSFPVTVVLNTVACLSGKRYVKALPAIGGGLLALSTVLDKFGKSSGEQ